MGNNGRGNEDGAISIAKAFVSTIEAWDNVLRQNSSQQGANLTEDMINGTMAAATELSRKYGVKGETLLGMIPEPYKPLVDGLMKKYGNDRWDTTVDLAARMMKEFGKDKETGKYRSTEEVLKDASLDMFQDRFLDYLFSS